LAMVKGLDIFKRHFASFAGHYLLIGGTACDLIMGQAGQVFRATQDLDIVLCAEAFTDSFVKKFWEFVELGGYSVRERATGKKEFYRFCFPSNTEYPSQLELFSRKPDALQIARGSTLTPLPAGEDALSLSAILLDDEYYQWILDGKSLINGVSVVRAEYLIPLKARAWLDMKSRKDAGEKIDSRKIKKHLNDVLRLFTILRRKQVPVVPAAIKGDIDIFLERIALENVDFKNLRLGRLTMPVVITDLRYIYNLEDRG